MDHQVLAPCCSTIVLQVEHLTSLQQAESYRRVRGVRTPGRAELVQSWEVAVWIHAKPATDQPSTAQQLGNPTRVRTVCVLYQFPTKWTSPSPGNHQAF